MQLGIAPDISGVELLILKAGQIVTTAGEKTTTSSIHSTCSESDLFERQNEASGATTTQRALQPFCSRDHHYPTVVSEKMPDVTLRKTPHDSFTHH